MEDVYKVKGLYIDFVGMIISFGIIWGVLPDSIPRLAKIGLTAFYILDHLGLMPTFALIFKEVEDEENEENDNND